MIIQSKRGFTVVCDKCGLQSATQPTRKRLRKDESAHNWKDLAGGQHLCGSCATDIEAARPKKPVVVRRPDTRTPEQRERDAAYWLAVMSIMAAPALERRWR